MRLPSPPCFFVAPDAAWAVFPFSAFVFTIPGDLFPPSSFILFDFLHVIWTPPWLFPWPPFWKLRPHSPPLHVYWPSICSARSLHNLFRRSLLFFCRYPFLMPPENRCLSLFFQFPLAGFGTAFKSLLFSRHVFPPARLAALSCGAPPFHFSLCRKLRILFIDSFNVVPTLPPCL